MTQSAVKGRVSVFLRRNLAKLFLFVAALLLISIVFNVSFKAVILIPLLIILASFSTFYFNYVSMPINFELVKLSTILVAVSYGFFQGLAVGVASTFFGKVLIGRIDEKLPISILTIAAMALAAALFGHSAGITELGITLVFAYNATMLTITMLMGGDAAWNIPYEGTNLLFNILLFAKVAPFLLELLS